jgi:hypothetical protein
MSDAEFRRRILDVVAVRDEKLERARRDRHRDHARLCAEVFLFLASHPDASKNAVTRAVTGRRSEILEAIDALREAERRFQTPGNRLSGSDGEAGEGL